MKRLVSLLICILLIGTLAVPALAAGTTQMTITTSSETAKPGDEIAFTVTIVGSDPCRSLGIVLQYDADVYEVVSGECQLEGVWFKTFEADKGFAFLYEEAAVPSGAMGTFVLKVKEGAASGETTVSGISSVKKGSETIASEVIGTNVTITGGAALNTSVKNTEAAATQQTEQSVISDEPAAQGGQTEPEATEAAATELETVGIAEETNAVETAAEETAAAAEDDAVEMDSGMALIIMLALLAAAVVCIIILLAVMSKNKKSSKRKRR